MQNRWQVVMTMFAVLAFVGCILEYFFTRERITEEDMVETDAGVNKAETTGTPSTLQQLKGTASDSYWWIIIIFYMLYQMGVMFKGGYVFNIFCHEFFQEVHIFGMTLSADMAQSVLALISGIPLAAGMLFIWPLANRFGKKNMILAGCVVSIAGSIVCLLAPDNFVVMLAGQTLKGFVQRTRCIYYDGTVCRCAGSPGGEAWLPCRWNFHVGLQYGTDCGKRSGCSCVQLFSMTAPCFPIKE